MMLQHVKREKKRKETPRPFKKLEFHKNGGEITGNQQRYREPLLGMIVSVATHLQTEDQLIC